MRGPALERAQQPLLDPVRAPIPLPGHITPGGGPDAPRSPHRRDVPLLLLHGGLPVHLAAGAAHRPPAHRRPERPGQALRLRTVRPELPVPLRVRQTPRAEPPRAPPGGQALLLRRLRDAVPVP